MWCGVWANYEDILLHFASTHCKAINLSRWDQMPVWVANAAKVVCRPDWANKYFFSTMMWAHTCSQPQSPYLVIDTDKFLAALSLILPLPNLKQIKPTSTHAKWSLYVAYAIWKKDFESDRVYTWGPIFGSACFPSQTMLRLNWCDSGWWRIFTDDTKSL